MLPTVEKLLVLESRPLRQALEVIDATAQGLCFVVDDSGRMTGMLTDGDIRRALLGGANLQVPVRQVMRREFVRLPVGSSAETIQEALTSKIRVVPLLAEGGRPIDYASHYRVNAIELARPSFNGNELAYATDCIKSGQIATRGEYTERFEGAVAEYVHAPFAVAASSGSAALELALLALEIGSGDDVIVPAFASSAVAERVLGLGAVPVFVDVDPQSWTLNVADVAAALSARSKAIIAVHVYGQVCDMDPLRALATKHGLAVIEDASDAFGARYKDESIGSHSDAAVFDFGEAKAPTTGAGGMVVFHDRLRHDRAKMVRDQGRDSHDSLSYWLAGSNCHLTNIQAAIGLAQVEQAAAIVEGKRRVADAYTRRLRELDGIELPGQPPTTFNVSSPYTVLVNEHSRVTRAELAERLRYNGIDSHSALVSLHLMPSYQKHAAGRKCPVSARLSEMVLCLPSDPSMSDEEIEIVCRSFESIFFVRRYLRGNK